MAPARPVYSEIHPQPVCDAPSCLDNACNAIGAKRKHESTRTGRANDNELW